MSLAALTMVRDEADIIVPILRHLSALFDMVFLLDQRSSDGCSQIMQQVCADRCGWHYRRVDMAGLHQKELYDLFMREAFAGGATAVFFVDSDEFIAGMSEPELAAKCRVLNETVVAGSFRWKACVPLEFDSWEFDPAAVMWIAKQPSSLRKIVIPRSLFDAMPDMRITQGAHSANPPQIMESQVFDMGFYYHVPIRSRQQLAQKVFLSAVANFSRNNVLTSEGFHKKQILELMGESRLSDDMLACIAGKYGEQTEIRPWARLSDMGNDGFERRAMDIPLSPIAISPPPRPDLIEVLARCLNDFRFEDADGGAGQVVVEENVAKFRAVQSGSAQSGAGRTSLISRLRAILTNSISKRP